jgi:hypothetical protein
MVPDSPMQLIEEIHRDQTQELEYMIKELESENATLQEEYHHLRATSTTTAARGAIHQFSRIILNSDSKRDS